MTTTRPRGLNTTIRCSTCEEPIVLSSDQYGLLKKDLRAAFDCPACGMRGEYSLLGPSRPIRVTPTNPIAPVAAPPFASLQGANESNGPAPAFAPVQAPAFAPVQAPPFAPVQAAKRTPKPPPVPAFNPAGSGMVMPVTFQPAVRKPTLGERWKSLSNGKQWAITLAMIAFVGLVILIIPTGSSPPPPEPVAQSGSPATPH